LFPARFAVYAYIRITDAEGDYTFRLEYVRSATLEIIESVELGVIRATDRLRYYDAVVPMTLNIPEPGAYELRVIGNGGQLGFTRLEVLAPSQQGG
jgi:hypothetical protein